MNNVFKRYFVAVAVLLAMVSCTKTKNPVVQNDRVQPFINHALISWEVEYEGDVASWVELAQNEDMTGAQRYGSQSMVSDKVFQVTADGLTSNTKYYYQIMVSDGKNNYPADVKQFTTNPPEIVDEVPVVVTLEASEVAIHSAVCGGSVTSEGTSPVMERGVCWGMEENPSINDSVAVVGEGADEFTVTLEGLESSTTYYFRAYAKNDVGVGYGEVKSFITEKEPELPTVVSLTVTEVAVSTAIFQGQVVEDGGEEITERGAVWSTRANPTLQTGDHQAAETAELGTYTINMTGLMGAKVYFVRGYAINSVGVSYGESISFETNDGMPSVTTGVVSDITETSVICHGEVTYQGGSNVTTRGFCYGSDENPDVNGRLVTAPVAGMGEYSCAIQSLLPNTTYHVRAFCHNSQGIAYGDDITFTTLRMMPQVTTSNVVDVTSNSAKGGGVVVTNNGYEILERGICWSTSPNPTTNDSHAFDPNLGSVFSTNTYVISMTGLESTTTYYVRAYVVVDEGTAYGEEVSFTTRAK